MPQVPFNPTGQGSKPMANPSPENLLMAAAQMHQQGKLVDPQPTMPAGSKTQPNPIKPHKASRRLRVVK